MITDWPSADRASLEARARKGLVAVRYEGCEMEVLKSCTVPGTYKYAGTTRKSDHLSIRNADELYATIPVFAAKLEGKLQSSGALDIDMTIVGAFEADRAKVSKAELSDPACETATHFIAAITAGAFEFFSGAGTETSGGVAVLGAGAGGKRAKQRQLLNRDGERSSCEKSSSKDAEPPEGCAALLRLELVEVDAAASSHATAKGTEAKPDRADSKTPVRFHWLYMGRADERRDWSVTGERTWQEKYPDGTMGDFVLAGRATIEGDDGILLRRSPDNRQEFFIPNKGSKRMLLRMRNRTPEMDDGIGTAPWMVLGEMRGVE